MICFSRARPLQLHGYLTSLFEQWSGDFTVSVLIRSESPYQGAYAEIVREFPQVRWRHEADFASDLGDLIGEAEFTCFGCDDAVYVAPLDADEIVGWMPDPVLGWSLRLGVNVTHDMFGSQLPQPELAPHGPLWDFRASDSVGDWGYPWEVLGTVYRTEFVKSMVAAIAPGSPSQLEERGSHCWGQHTDLTYMAAYPFSRLVVPTVNIVQSEFPNGIRGTKVLEPEFLLDCWNHGLRLDTEHYVGMKPESWRVPEFYMRRAA